MKIVESVRQKHTENDVISTILFFEYFRVFSLVYVGWRGPNCTKENLKLTACSVLLRYLSETSVSPLQREMVEIADPYASTVSYNIIENYESALYFSFENVPFDKIDLVYDKMKSIVGNIAKIDMIRMQNILERCILEYFSNLESNPHEALAFATIADSLYGETEDDVRFSCFSLIITFKFDFSWQYKYK